MYTVCFLEGGAVLLEGDAVYSVCFRGWCSTSGGRCSIQCVFLEEDAVYSGLQRFRGYGGFTGIFQREDRALLVTEGTLDCRSALQRELWASKP